MSFFKFHSWYSKRLQPKTGNVRYLKWGPNGCSDDSSFTVNIKWLLEINLEKKFSLFPRWPDNNNFIMCYSNEGMSCNIILILIAIIYFPTNHKSRYGLCSFFIKNVPLIFAVCTLVRVKTLTSKIIAVLRICGWKLCYLQSLKCYFLILFLWFYDIYGYFSGQELPMKSASLPRGTDQREKEIDDRSD